MVWSRWRPVYTAAKEAWPNRYKGRDQSDKLSVTAAMQMKHYLQLRLTRKKKKTSSGRVSCDVAIERAQQDAACGMHVRAQRCRRSGQLALGKLHDVLEIGEADSTTPGLGSLIEFCGHG